MRESPNIVIGTYEALNTKFILRMKCEKEYRYYVFDCGISMRCKSTLAQ